MYDIIKLVIVLDLNLVKGVGEKAIEYLSNLNLYTINDLLFYYPYRYNFIKVIPLLEAPDDVTVTIKGIVDTEPRVSYINKSLNKMVFRINTDGYLVNVTIFNRSFYKSNLKLGRMINLIGKYNRQKNTFTASDIKFEIIRDFKIEPVYHLVKGIKSKGLSKLINECFNMNVEVEDYIPKYIVDKYKFMNKLEAAYNIHFPSNIDILKKARLRAIYEEFFIFMFKMNYLKHQYDLDNVGLGREVDRLKVDEFINTYLLN